MPQIILEGDVLDRDTVFSFGGCVLVLHKGSHLITEERGNKIAGGFHFRKGDFLYQGESVWLCEGNHFCFDMEVAEPKELAIGIRYFTTGWDTFLGRYDQLETQAEIFSLPKGIDLSVEFSPFLQQGTVLTVKKEQRVKCSFTTIYGEELSAKLPAGFTFVLQKRVSMGDEDSCYFAPSGEVIIGETGKLMLGLSGTEYVTIKEGMHLFFTPGQPAFFPLDEGQREEETSYLGFSNTSYYSQNSSTPFFSPEEGGCYLHTELPGFYLEKEHVLPLFFPVVKENKQGVAVHIEQEYLSHIRRESVEKNLKILSKGNRGESAIAVSRNGMILMQKENAVLWIQVASIGSGYPDVAFTQPDSRFMAGFMAKELCMVLCNMGQLQGLSDTPYSVTEDSLKRARAGGYSFTEELQALKGKTYLLEEDFIQAVRERTKEESISSVLMNACDHFTVSVEGFTFFLGKHQWNSKECVFFMKLNTNASLLECLENPIMWSLKPETSQTDEVEALVKKAEKRAAELGDGWLTEALHQKEWQGCISFYVPVDCDNMPEELQFLGDNLKTDKMRALYVAVPAATGLNPENLKGQGSKNPVMALIDYEDDVHQYYEDARELAFKVQNLRVKIENRKITLFQAKVELLINRLFGGKVCAIESEAGNNLVFDGHYQREEEGGRYVFTLLGEVCYGISGCAWYQFLVKEGELLTNGKKARFLLGGNVVLYPYEEVDLLSYDSVKCNGLLIDMESSKGGNQFQVTMDSLVFDTDEVLPRVNSLGSCFPLMPKEIFYVKGRTPVQAGYLPLKVSREKSEVEEEWYGMTLKIPLGDMGSLVSGSSLGLSLLVAWIPSKEGEEQLADGAFTYTSPRFFTGIQLLSGGNAVNLEIPLEGILTLGFESIELHKKEDSYVFRFRNFALQLLGFRFPQTNNDMYLIADKNKVLGWYGAAGEG